MGFLWEEENLVFEVLVKNEGALAWEDAERGRFVRTTLIQSSF